MYVESLKFKLVVFIAAAILVVDIEAQSQRTCTTQWNEVGLCVPISKCEIVMQQIAAGRRGELLPLPLTVVVQTVSLLFCGTFNGVSHVCCKQNNVTRQIAPTSVGRSNGGEIHGYCSTASVGSGVTVCVPILTCRTAIELLHRSPMPLPTSVIQTLRRSHCGTFGNVHHVCCLPSHVTIERPSTPKYTTEMAVVNRLEPTNEVTCTTLRNETGACVPISSCETITRLLQVSGWSGGSLPPSISEIVRRSNCGTYSNANQVYVCCKLNRVTRLLESELSTGTRFGTSTEVNTVNCSTPLNKPGVCVPMLTCGTITRMLQNSQGATAPLPIWVIRTVKQSHCGTVSNVHNVCCQPNEVEKINTRTSDFDHFLERRAYCRTEDNEMGLCVPMLSCEAVTELLQKSSGSSPLSQLIVETVVKSHCGTYNDIHHVCCKLSNPTGRVASTRRNPVWL